MRKVTYIEIDFRELEQLIEKTYGIKYEVVPDEGWNNDSCYPFDIRKEKLDKWESEKLESFKKTGKSKMILSTLLRDMCNNNILASGNYLIDVCW